MSDRDGHDEPRAVDVDALVRLAADMRRDAELGFVVWGAGRLAGAADEIEAALGGEEGRWGS